MISPAKALVAILILLGLLSPAAAEVSRLDYEGFAVWLDCERRGAVKFRYNAHRDQGNVERTWPYTNIYVTSRKVAL